MKACLLSALFLCAACASVPRKSAAPANEPVRVETEAPVLQQEGEPYTEVPPPEVERNNDVPPRERPRTHGFFAALCVPQGSQMGQAWELIILAHHDGARWLPIASLAEPDASVRPEFVRQFAGLTWTEMNKDYPPRIVTTTRPEPIALANFEQGSLVSVKIGNCIERERFDSIFISGPVEPITPPVAARQRVLAAVHDLGGAYDHFWFSTPSAPGLLLGGGNTSGLLGGYGGSRSAFAGEWLAQLDDEGGAPEFTHIVLRHY